MYNSHASVIQHIQAHVDDYLRQSNSLYEPIQKEAFAQLQVNYQQKETDDQNVKIYDAFRQVDLKKKASTMIDISDNTLPLPEVYTLYLHNGNYQPQRSYLPASFVCFVQDVHQVSDEKTLEMLAFFGKKNLDNNFYLLNTALLQQFVYIKIPPHIVLDKPLVIKHQHDAQNTLVNYRTCVQVGKNSHVHIIEHVVQPSTETHILNISTDFFLDEAACVHHYHWQNDCHNYLIHHVHSQLASKSNFNTYAFSLTGHCIKNHLHISLNGEHAKAHMYGAYILNKKIQVSNLTTVQHLQPYTTSHELYHGILFDQSLSRFIGKIFVDPIAQKTQAYQSNHHLVLSDEALMLTQPQLVILADDVKCSHGATTGQLNPVHLFYLQSRGIALKAAKAILLSAFIRTVIEKIPHVAIKNMVLDVYEKKMKN